MRNIENTCRFCLKRLDDFSVDIFHAENGTKLADELKDILLLDFQLEDIPNRPKNACLDCVDFLRQLKWFRVLITSSNETLVREGDLAESTLVMETTVNENPNIIEFEIGEPTPFTEIKPQEAPQPTYEPSSVDFVQKNEPPALVGSENSEMELDQEIYLEQEIELDQERELDALSLDGLSDCSERDTSTTTSTAYQKIESKVKMKKKPSIVRYPYPLQNEDEEDLEKIMVDMKLFVCKICELNCEMFPTLRDHVMAEHPSDFNSYEICCQTTIQIKEKRKLYDHIRLHLDKETYKCQECSKCLSSKQGLREHTIKHHTKGRVPPKFVCPICGMGFPALRHLNDHQKMKHGPKHKCEFCQVELSTAAGYRKHVQKQHEKVVNLLCEICGKGYPTKNQLSSHIMDHGGPHGGRRKKKSKAAPPTVDLPYDDEYFEKN